MPLKLILAALGLMFLGCIWNPVLLASGSILLIVSLALLGKAPLGIVLLFAVWLLSVLASLIFVWATPTVPGEETPLILGLPAPTFLMILGIWVLPILIFPLGFLLSFERWLRK